MLGTLIMKNDIVWPLIIYLLDFEFFSYVYSHPLPISFSTVIDL